MKIEEIRQLLCSCLRGTEFAGKVYFAGGAVRDFLRGVDSSDIDICVELDQGGIRLAKYLSGVWNTAAPVLYESFGTAMIMYQGLKLEFVMTRAESYRPQNRNPKVAFAPLLQDVLRRDFSINALVMDVETASILDLSGMGLDDLKRKIIRTVGSPQQVFEQDPLRILRAIRFSAQLGFEIDPSTRSAISESAKTLKFIRAERIAEEINKLLSQKKIMDALCLVQDSGVMELILPEVSRLKDVLPNRYHHLDALHHSFEVAASCAPRLLLRWAGLLHDTGKFETQSEDSKGIHYYGHERQSAEIAQRVLKRFMLCESERKQVAWAIANHMRYKRIGKKAEEISEKNLRKLALEDDSSLDLLLELVHQDNLAHAPQYRLPEQIPALRVKLLECREILQNQRFILTGKDLIDVFSINSGPLVGEMLTFAKDKWLENTELQSSELIDMIAKRFGYK